MRWLLRSMPPVFWPPGFDPDVTMSYMRIYSEHSSITGESGDDIGRGGRTLIYFKDESAHYEHPESIEAALGDTTRVQVDISSVNGLGNVFHRKREAGIEWQPGTAALRGKTNVFIMDWSDHPEKTQAWYNEREARAIDDGLLHVFRQEVDRNYAASVEGVVIPPEWIRSSIDAHIKLRFEEHPKDDCYAGLDVADGGGDRNALAIREGVTLRAIEQWGERDTGVTTRKAIDGVQAYGRRGRRVSVQYDSVGVGSGVKAESNRLSDDDLMPKYIDFISWNAGAAVLDPDKRIDPDDHETPLNKDFYTNLKAQGWWQLRRRFEKTHRAVTEGIEFPPDELISIPSDLPLLRTLQKELSQPTMSRGTRMRLMIDKQPEGTRSPNLADAIVMAYWPVGDGLYASMDWV
jgi:phage terminase large subunit